jgi:RNA polymerase sigma-70 factor, ECF subfamily
VLGEQELTWVLQARKGDQSAFAKLVEAYQVPVYNLAYRMLGTPNEAEDAAQETFLRAYTHLESYDASRKFSSWILSIASHHCVDRLRRRRGNTVSMEEIMSWRWVPDDLPKPEEQTVQHEDRAVIRRLLDQLPGPYRLVIVLRYWNELSYEEMAEVTHTTESAVKSRLHRAREMMAVMLAAEQGGASVANHSGRRVPEHAMSRSF